MKKEIARIRRAKKLRANLQKKVSWDFLYLNHWKISLLSY